MPTTELSQREILATDDKIRLSDINPFRPICQLISRPPDILDSPAFPLVQKSGKFLQRKIQPALPQRTIACHASRQQGQRCTMSSGGLVQLDVLDSAW